MLDAKEFARRVAAKNGWSLQPDEDFLGTVTAGLETTRRTHGYFLCPCREGWGEKEKDRDIICPCDYAGSDIEEFGQCFCGLFLSPEKARSGAAAETIPDRRPENLYPD